MIFISDRLGKMGVGQKPVLLVKGVSTEALNEEKFLPGDVIEQLRAEAQVSPVLKAPFSGGKSGFCRELRKLSSVDKLYVRVARQGRKLEFTASVVTGESVLRRSYSLADYEDRSYVTTFMDATEEECAALQEQSRRALQSRGKSRISTVQMKDCLISYSWQQKMSHFLPPPNSAIVFSLLVMPFQPSRPVEFNDVDDTSARAMAWLSASQKIGVPIIFVNIQTEPILRQGSTNVGFGVGSQEEALSVANSGSYTVHEEAGSDIGVLRGIRLWYAPGASELALNLIPDESERLGVGISHTEEGFCYVSSVEYGTAADRAGLKEIYESARSIGKLVVISRIGGRKVTPWMVQSSGAIRCFDTLLISEILSLHKQALQPIQMFVMLWSGFAVNQLSTSGSQSNSSHSHSQLSAEKFFGHPQPQHLHQSLSHSQSQDRSSTSSVTRWEQRSSGVSSERGRESNVDSLSSPRTSSPRTSSHCSVRYFNNNSSNNTEESSENDFSFSF